MFRYVDKTTLESFVKDATRRMAGRVLGLDVQRGRSRGFDLHPYARNLEDKPEEPIRSPYTDRYFIKKVKE